MHKDLIVAKLRENCRVGKYLLDSRDHLKKSVEELDDAIELLTAVHYDDSIDTIMNARSILEALINDLDKKSDDLDNEAMALDSKLERLNG